MQSPHYTSTPKELYRYAATVRQPHRRWQDQGPKGTVTTLLQILLYAAAPLCSLDNVWGWVHWRYLATLRRGALKLNLHKLRFKTLLMWLTHLAEETFGINDTVVAERVP